MHFSTSCLHSDILTQPTCRNTTCNKRDEHAPLKELNELDKLSWSRPASNEPQQASATKPGSFSMCSVCFRKISPWPGDKICPSDSGDAVCRSSWNNSGLQSTSDFGNGRPSSGQRPNSERIQYATSPPALDGSIHHSGTPTQKGDSVEPTTCATRPGLEIAKNAQTRHAHFKPYAAVLPALLIMLSVQLFTTEDVTHPHQVTSLVQSG